jgi:hypothetical protein
VGEEYDVGVAPAEFDVGMVVFAFGERADFVHENKRFSKVFEPEPVGNFVIIFNRPSWYMGHKCLNIGGRKFPLAPFAWSAFF